YKQEYNNIYQYFKRNNPTDINTDFWEKVIRKNAINNIVLRKIESDLAENMKVVVSDKELSDRIQNDQNFLENGKFDRQRYLQILRANKLHPGDYEAGYRNNVKVQKMEEIIASGVLLSEKEVLEAYSLENEQAQASYLVIDNDFFEKKVDVNSDELKNFFDTTKETFKTKEKLTTSLLVSEPSAFEQGINIQEERVTEFYETNQKSFLVPKQIKARHILIRTSGGLNEDDDKKALKKAEEVLQLVKGGGDFADHAKEHSDDFSSREGGDLGFFSKGRMVKPFEDVAFSLKEGEISGIVKTQFGYHIIKVEKIREEKIKPIEIVKVEIENRLKKQDARLKAREVLEKIAKEENLSSVGLKGFAAKIPELKTAEYILSKGDPFHRVLSSTAFSLKVGDVSGVVEESGKFYILRPVSKEDSYIPEFEEIKGEVELAFRRKKAQETRDVELSKMVEGVKSGIDLNQFSSEKGFPLKKTEFFKRGGFVPELSMDSKPFIEKALLAEKGEFGFQAGQKKSYIFFIEEKKDIDTDLFAENRKSFTKNLLEKKRTQFLNQWRQGLIKRAEEEGRLKISEGFI
ncbi:MAG: peptidylprolyl isomerase, partial [Nitrospinota bacterium]